MPTCDMLRLNLIVVNLQRGIRPRSGEAYHVILSVVHDHVGVSHGDVLGAKVVRHVHVARVL